MHNLSDALDYIFCAKQKRFSVNTFVPVLFCLFLFCLVSRPCNAQLSVPITLPVLTSSADLICSGAVDRNADEKHKGYVDVVIDNVLKGKTGDRRIILIGVQLGDIPASLQSGLFFLVGDGKSRYWQLEQAVPGPVIDLGSGISHIPNNLSPFRSVLLSIAMSISTSNTDNQLQLLYRLADMGYLLSPKSKKYISLASELGETNGLRDFCSQSILPLVKVLNTSPAMDVRVNAFLIQAIMQDITVLPQLRKIVEAAGSAPTVHGYVNLAGEAISCYKDAGSVPLMLDALSSPSLRVQNAALSSLVKSLGYTSLPLLLNRIGNNNFEQNSVIIWLWQLTGEMKPQGDDLGTGQQQKYIHYWKLWKSSHTGELKRLNDQLETFRHPQK